MFHGKPPVIRYAYQTLWLQKSSGKAALLSRNRSSFGFGAKPFGPQKASRSRILPDLFFMIAQFLFQHKQERKSIPKTGPAYGLQELFRHHAVCQFFCDCPYILRHACKMENVGIKFKKLKQRA
ncbi:MAG: hypothetical protein IJ649_02800 [Oscillospiraceae bacterium]|nr:hypothetical protein [Oscillospiraceae bacterium]